MQYLYSHIQSILHYQPPGDASIVGSESVNQGDLRIANLAMHVTDFFGSQKFENKINLVLIRTTLNKLHIRADDPHMKFDFKK